MKPEKMETETIYYGDCLKLMREWDKQREEFYNIGQGDWIYLAPPFNSKANYNILFEKAKERTAQETTFTNIWTWKGNQTRPTTRKGNLQRRSAPRAQIHLRNEQADPRKRHACLPCVHGGQNRSNENATQKHRIHLSALRFLHQPLPQNGNGRRIRT